MRNRYYEINLVAEANISRRTVEKIDIWINFD